MIYVTNIKTFQRIQTEPNLKCIIRTQTDVNITDNLNIVHRTQNELLINNFRIYILFYYINISNIIGYILFY